jgi:phenylalanine-4-hydroxylase
MMTPADGLPVPHGDDFVIDQGWDAYTSEDHAIWRTLFERQSQELPCRACR